LVNAYLTSASLLDRCSAFPRQWSYSLSYDTVIAFVNDVKQVETVTIKNKKKKTKRKQKENENKNK